MPFDQPDDSVNVSGVLDVERNTPKPMLTLIVQQKFEVLLNVPPVPLRNAFEHSSVATNEPTLSALVVDEQDRRGVALFHQHHITVFLFEAHLEERKSASTRHSDVEGESGL